MNDDLVGVPYIVGPSPNIVVVEDTIGVINEGNGSVKITFTLLNLLFTGLLININDDPICLYDPLGSKINDPQIKFFEKHGLQFNFESQ